MYLQVCTQITPQFPGSIANITKSLADVSLKKIWATKKPRTPHCPNPHSQGSCELNKKNMSEICAVLFHVQKQRSHPLHLSIFISLSDPKTITEIFSATCATLGSNSNTLNNPHSMAPVTNLGTAQLQNMPRLQLACFGWNLRMRAKIESFLK